MVAEVVRYAHNIYCQLYEAGEIVFVNVTSPATPNCSQACTVSNVPNTAQFVLDLVASPVTKAAFAGSIIVGKRTAPHNFCTSVVVSGVFFKNLSVAHGSFQYVFANSINDVQLFSFCCGEEAFQSVHHNINTTAGSLISRKSVSKFRVQNAELAVSVGRSQTTFQPTIFVGNYGRSTHFATCSCNGKYCCSGDATGNGAFAFVIFPNIAFVSNTVSNSLSAINGTTATNSEDEVNAFCFAQFNAFVNFRKARVRNNTAQEYKFKTSFSKACAYSV